MTTVIVLESVKKSLSRAGHELFVCNHGLFINTSDCAAVMVSQFPLHTGSLAVIHRWNVRSSDTSVFVAG